MSRLKRRSLGGWIVKDASSNLELGWVVKRGNRWLAYEAPRSFSLRTNGRLLGDFSLRREAVDEVMVEAAAR